MLRGQTVKIVVSEPFEWSAGDLQGTIIDDHTKGSLLIQLTKLIEGKKFTSNLLEVRPRFADKSFEISVQDRPITVNGALIKSDSDDFEFIFIGSLTIR